MMFFDYCFFIYINQWLGLGGRGGGGSLVSVFESETTLVTSMLETD